MTSSPGVIGFLGFGAMAEAIITGLHESLLVSPKGVIVYDIDTRRAQAIQKEIKSKESPKFEITIAASNKEVVASSNVVILAVKPNNVKEVLEETVAEITSTNPLIISICAGVTIATLESYLPSKHCRVCRVMPNVNAIVGAAASAFCMSKAVEKGDNIIAAQVFSSIGTVKEVKEELMDAVTGLSGSGPAYVFSFIEALADGGVRAGLPRDVALLLAVQTVYGSAKMVLEQMKKPNGLHSAALKDMVCSPGGTTIAGVHELEKGALRGTVMNAVLAATKRSEELGKK